MPVQLKVLFTVAEVFPLVKTGGLADVAAALPEALKERGVDVRILLPGYRSVISLLRTRPVGKPFRPLLSADRVRLLRSELPGRGIPIYLIDAPALYDRPGGPYSDPYGKDWWDNAIRFGVLSKVGALFGSSGGLDGWKADVLPPPRLARGAGVRLYAFRPAGHRCDRLYGSQPGLPGQLRPQGPKGAGHQFAGLSHGRAGVSRQPELHEGRSVLLGPDFDGQPDLCTSDPDAGARMRDGWRDQGNGRTG